MAAKSNKDKKGDKPAKTEKATSPVLASERRKLGEKGHLAGKVKKITDAYVAGKLKIEDGKPLTPTRVANLIASELNTEKPSVGAVNAVFDRWVDYGFCTMTDGPRAFKGYTAEGKKKGLSAMIEERAAARHAETVARQEAAKAAKPAKAKAEKATKAPATKKATKKATAKKA